MPISDFAHHNRSHPHRPYPNGPRRDRRRLLMIAGFAAVGVLVGGAVVVASGPGGSGLPGGRPGGAEEQAAAPHPAAAPVDVLDAGRTGESAEPPVEVVEVPPPATDTGWADAPGGDRVETPCFTFQAPTMLQNVSTPAQSAGCIAEASATVQATVDGATTESLWGQVAVTSLVFDSPLPTDSAEALDVVWAEYFAGAPSDASAPREAVSLDGAPAELVTFPGSGSALDVAVLAAFTPTAYVVDGMESQTFLVTLIAPPGSAGEYVQQVLDTWQWN